MVHSHLASSPYRAEVRLHSIPNPLLACTHIAPGPKRPKRGYLLYILYHGAMQLTWLCLQEAQSQRWHNGEIHREHDCNCSDFEVYLEWLSITLLLEIILMKTVKSILHHVHHAHPYLCACMSNHTKPTSLIRARAGEVYHAWAQNEALTQSKQTLVWRSNMLGHSTGLTSEPKGVNI